MRLVERFGGRCFYCDTVLTFDEARRTSATRDHVHPVSKGGQSTHENLVAACAWCNNRKGDMTLHEWFTDMCLRMLPWPPDPRAQAKPTAGSRQRRKDWGRRRKERMLRRSDHQSAGS